MNNDKKPKFTKEFLSSSLFRIDALVTQGKLSAQDFPLRAYKLRASYPDMHAEAMVAAADSWFLSDRTNAELVMQRYDRSLGALGDMINCVTLAADFFRRAPETRAQSKKLLFISSVKGINLITPPDNEFFTKRSSQAVNDITTFLAEQEKPSIIAVSTGVYSEDGGRSWDNDFTKHTGKTAKCMLLNTGHDYAFKNGQNVMVFDLSK
ncbi:MAG: hypothetical protein ACOX66_06460 [Oscillospiraceae bacterium]|jgi:hypothetical protein